MVKYTCPARLKEAPPDDNKGLYVGMNSRIMNTSELRKRPSVFEVRILVNAHSRSFICPLLTPAFSTGIRVEL